MTIVVVITAHCADHKDCCGGLAQGLLKAAASVDDGYVPMLLQSWLPAYQVAGVSLHLGKHWQCPQVLPSLQDQLCRCLVKKTVLPSNNTYC